MFVNPIGNARRLRILRHKSTARRGGSLSPVDYHAESDSGHWASVQVMNQSEIKSNFQGKPSKLRKLAKALMFSVTGCLIVHFLQHKAIFLYSMRVRMAFFTIPGGIIILESLNIDGRLELSTYH